MNSLDAICIATTSAEIDSGHLERLFHQLNDNHYSNIPLLIFTNNSNYGANITLLNNKYKTIVFKYIKIVNIDIPTYKDIYHYNKQSQQIPELGTVSGPNIMFFFIMNFCYKQKFDTILLLETDCFIKPDMISICKEYVKNNTFFISGSKYLGNMGIPSKIADHINGVAFYKTGSTEFQDLINNVNKFIKTQVAAGDVSHAYDVSIFLYLEKLKKNNTKYSKLIKNYVQTNLILNFSPRGDASITNEYINLKYPNHVILHKKL
jgi:hypothetical protein